MIESIHDYVVDQLQGRWKGYWTNVAEGTGMSRRTIEKIAYRTVKNPGVIHIENLAGYFRQHAPPERRTNSV